MKILLLSLLAAASFTAQAAPEWLKASENTAAGVWWLDKASLKQTSAGIWSFWTSTERTRPSAFEGKPYTSSVVLRRIDCATRTSAADYYSIYMGSALVDGWANSGAFKPIVPDSVMDNVADIVCNLTPAPASIGRSL